MAVAREQAIGMLKRGETPRRIGGILGVSNQTVKRWGVDAGVIDDLGNVKAEAPPALAPEAEPSEPAPDESVDGALRTMIRQRDRLEKLGNEAAAEGNSKLAGQLLKESAQLANRIAGIKAKMGGAAGEITFSREQLEQARKNLTGLVEKLMRSPEVKDRLCPRCAAEIRIAWASEPGTSE